MSENLDDDYTPGKLMQVTAKKLQAVEKINKQIQELKFGGKNLEKQQLSNFKEYTHFLDKTVDQFKELAKDFEDQFNDMNQWWNIDDDEITESDVRELKNQLDKFMNTIQSIFNLYKNTHTFKPPNDCSTVHHELKQMLEDLLDIPDECRVLFNKFVDNPHETLEQEEKITIQEDGTISIDFGYYGFDLDRVIQPWKTLFQQKRQSNDFAKGVFSGIVDFIILDTFIDF